MRSAAIQSTGRASASPGITSPNVCCAIDQGEMRALVKLREQLHDAGMSLIICSESGEAEFIVQPNDATSATSCLATLLHTSPLVAERLRCAVQGLDGWSKQTEPAPVEAIPGMWFAPIPLLVRRNRRGQRAGYAVIVIVTIELLSPSNEYLATMCQAGQLDLEMTRRQLAKLPPASTSESEVARLVMLATYLYQDHAQLTAHDLELESTGRQLAESYEEISLLYSIIQSMTAPGMQQPERFISICCDELLDTLPYSWIGAQLATNQNRMKQLSGRLFLAGDVPLEPRAMRRVTMALLESAMPDIPMVLEPGSSDTSLPKSLSDESILKPSEGGDCSTLQRDYHALGESILVHPVCGGGERQEVVGILVAGGKQGPDRSANNVDMKLLGAVASHMAIFIENAALYDDLNAMFLGTLEALTASIDAKDRYTCGHSQRVAHLTQQLAKVIGLGDNEVKRMHIAGLVHDVGKIGVPESLLLKPGKLTDEEFDWIKKHPEMGYRILRDIPQLQDILPGVLYHHERWDGKGYPSGLKGEAIPLVARLIGLADSFDAMSSTRTYRAGLQREQVLNEIMVCAGTQFDPALAPVFVDLDFSEYDRLVTEHHAGGATAA